MTDNILSYLLIPILQLHYVLCKIQLYLMISLLFAEHIILINLRDVHTYI